MDSFVQSLQAHYTPHRNPEKAESMSRYMKNQFPFLGIQTPERRQLLRTFLAEHGKPAKEDLPAIVRGLWALPEREYPIIALDLLEKNIKHIDESFVPLFEEIITTKSWWDTVDYIAARLVGTVFAASPHLISHYIPKWMESGNMWLQRSAILFQLKYKSNTDTNLLFSIIQELSDSKEFFIQKAIGWALREYAKTDAQAVLQFAEAHSLAPLSKREALKHIKAASATN
jgi:3-methyladenine DNA glycosylase AlkD